MQAEKINRRLMSHKGLVIMGTGGYKMGGGGRVEFHPTKKGAG